MSRLPHLLRSTSQLTPPHGPILLLPREDIQRDADPNLRLEELGAFAVKVALTKHLAFTYPDASPALLSDLRDANLTRHNLTLVADRLEAKGYVAQMKMSKNMRGGKRVKSKKLGKGYRAGMYAQALQVAGIMYVDSKYDLHDFWMNKYKDLMEPIVSPEDLETRRAAARLFETEMTGITEVVARNSMNLMQA